VVSAGVVQARPYRAERVFDASGLEKPSAYRRVEPCSIEPWEIFRITTAAKANRRVSEALPDFSLDSKESEGCNRMAQNHLLRLPQDLRSMKCVGLKVFGAGLFFQKVSRAALIEMSDRIDNRNSERRVGHIERRHPSALLGVVRGYSIELGKLSGFC